ncbi:DUF3505 domain-containing protein, partial [Pectobacterium carotovorum subsp. carotovorum]|nr:DUF3505 domain-containing protein [Pectobacterium carotovorum subsp. carotovorum]
MAANEIQIDYVERLSIFVCKLCECVVSGSQIAQHLRLKRHRAMNHNTKAMRTVLLEKLGASCGVDLSVLRLPPSPILAIPGLPVFHDGLACEYPGAECKFILRNVTRLHAHLRKEHQWVNKQPRGRKRTEDEKALAPWRSNVPCQQFVPDGRYAQL